LKVQLSHVLVIVTEAALNGGSNFLFVRSAETGPGEQFPMRAAVRVFQEGFVDFAGIFFAIVRP